MAISPKQLEEAFQNEVNNYEQHFDRALASKKITKGETLQIDVPKTMNWQHFIILRERYIAAGWTEVAWNSDQREGDWLTFKY